MRGAASRAEVALLRVEVPSAKRPDPYARPAFLSCMPRLRDCRRDLGDRQLDFENC